jgi:hypothetical protein
MNRLPSLAPHREVDARAARALALDPAYGVSSIPVDAIRGLLVCEPGVAPIFWAADERYGGWSVLEPAEEVAREFEAVASVTPRLVLEIAVGVFPPYSRGGWRLADILRIDDLDVAHQTTQSRAAMMPVLSQRWRALRLPMLETAKFVTGPGKEIYLAEGPGRPGDRLAFRRRDNPYGEAWLLRP